MNKSVEYNVQQPTAACLFKSKIQNRKSKIASGSALILTVVISVLLAVIAVLFILRTSVDSVGTMSVSDNKELSYAAETVLTQLNRELVLDVPGVKTLTQPLGQEYQDYPWTNAAVGPADPLWKLDDRWLANLEPYRSGSRYYWRHVSDLYGDRGTACNDLRIYDSDPNAPVNGIVSDGAVTAAGNLADADGDGVADSVWVQAMAASSTPLRTSKGKEIFLALRVVDLGAMLNANTAYRFDPTSVFESRVDGSSVTQVNLFGLALRSTALPPNENKITQLQAKWQGNEPNFILSDYETMVAKRLDSPQGGYSPFGINEELKLRYRYILDFNAATTRMDNNAGMNFWADVWEGGKNTPLSSLPDWQPRVTRRDLVPAETSNAKDPNAYDYRHITTTFNCDRLIDPNGQNMTNVNTATAQTIYNRLGVVMPAVDPNVLAQLAVNIKDYRDADNQVTAFKPNVTDPNGVLFNLTFYGHSSPFMWISEIAFSRQTIGLNTYPAYAVEVYVPQITPPTSNYRLVVDGTTVDGINLTSSGSWGSQFHVLLNDTAPGGLFTPLADPNTAQASTVTFNEGSVIQLKRLASDGQYVTVDSVRVPLGWPPVGIDPVRSVRRDITNGHCIRKVWDLTPGLGVTLGVGNGFVGLGDELQYLTKDDDFTTIGELGGVLTKATNDVNDADTESSARFNWLVSPFSDVARYFTIMTATAGAGDRIYGRININTAPYFALAQLPWMQYDYPMASTDPARFARARDAIAQRESVNGFRSVADVLKAPRMQDLATGGVSLPPPPGSPDLSFDTVIDDFEERDIIFSRISNLATVRSDVFCAYILIRLGEDGPQKRVMVILDRSGVRSSTDKVKVRAFHPVPDPR